MLVERGHGILPSLAAGEAYGLTAKGRSLLPVLQSLADWGLANIRGTEARMKPVTG
jgi:DNA-binding HxlR family transcriptional regulator